jgi:hypothetical protein
MPISNELFLFDLYAHADSGRLVGDLEVSQEEFISPLFENDPGLRKARNSLIPLGPESPDTGPPPSLRSEKLRFAEFDLFGSINFRAQRHWSRLARSPPYVSLGEHALRVGSKENFVIHKDASLFTIIMSRVKTEMRPDSLQLELYLFVGNSRLTLQPVTN